MAKTVHDKHGESHEELYPQEARQARFGRPVLVVMILGILGTVIAFGLAGYFFAG